MTTSSNSMKIDLKREKTIEYNEKDRPEQHELKQLNHLLETHIENSKHLENILPSKFSEYDAGCIRKYSNFSFPSKYNSFYNFIDYIPNREDSEDNDIYSTPSLELFLKKRNNNRQLKDDFIDTLKLVSPKTQTLLDKIDELDEGDMLEFGKKFKHFIFSDSKTSMAGVKLLANALIAKGMKLGYKAEPKYAKTSKDKKWGKMELLSNESLEKSKYNNFYMLSSKSVYDEPISVPTKKEILARFNERPENVYGKNVRIILMDGGYKEGIDLFDIKYVHIFEPTLTQADQKQVIGRGTRTCGQKGLDFHPSKGWPLYVFVYDLKIEDPFDKVLGAKSGIELYFKAKNINIKLLNFMSELETVCIQNAVDYELNKNIHSFSINNGGSSLSYSSSSLSESLPKTYSSPNPPKNPLNAEQMRKYVRDNFSQYAWERVVMENNCIPKGGYRKIDGMKGGATIMNYTPTQAFVSNFFTPNNPLKGMLLWHSVGTGKTCTAIATATSSFEKQGYTILWVTRTTLKNDIWKNMFDQVCHEIIKLKIEKDGIAIPSKNADRMKLLSKSWRIRPMSYKQFSNLVSKKNQIYEKMVKINGKEDPLRKTLLIIDEAHKLYGGGDLSSIETPDMGALHASLMNSYIMSGENSVKLLLMTATPIQSDPMELIRLINLFKMPNKQIPDNFDVFSEEYLDENGFFRPNKLNKFRDEIAGNISYLNREKDARQFSQPIVSIIKTDVYNKEFLRHNKKATEKLYSILGKEMKQTMKTLKKNPILKEKVSKGFQTMKEQCNKYENPKAKMACKRIITSYKKETETKLKESKEIVKKQLSDYKTVVGEFNDLKKVDVLNAENNELNNPILFRSSSDKMENIKSVYGRLNTCKKQETNSENLVKSAILNNPEISQLQNMANYYKQRIQENADIVKKEKNAKTKKVIRGIMVKDGDKLNNLNKSYKKKLKQFTTFVKKTLKQTKKKEGATRKKQQKVIKTLHKLKLIQFEMEDKDLEKNINLDVLTKVKKIADEIELKAKLKEEKKLEKEQKKIEKKTLAEAKQHAKTLKNKENKEFIKQQKARDAEIKKLEKREEEEMEMRRKKEAMAMKKEAMAMKKEAMAMKKEASKKQKQTIKKGGKTRKHTRKNI